MTLGKIKIAFIVMVFITLALGIVVTYAVVTGDEEQIHRCCLTAIRAVPLDEEPAYYNDDNASFCFYVIEALENPGTRVEAEVYIFHITAHDWWMVDEDGIDYTYPGDYVKYAGKFYMIDEAGADPPLHWFLSEEIINQTPIYVGVLGAGWTVFGVGVLYVRRKPQQTVQSSS